jgi:hypothetical protein
MIMQTRTHMYADTKTWNPFVGCYHGCIYCKVSFQRQLKRWAKKNCIECYNYTPHVHPERLRHIPSSKIVFVCGDGDIAFCSMTYLLRIIKRISEHEKRCPNKTYYFQSKNWEALTVKRPFSIPEIIMNNVKNAVILETLETNRDWGYRKISHAPLPTQRHKVFREIIFPHKVITIEPILDFDLNPFFRMITDTEPEYVWIGYNSKPNLIQLPEPSLEQTTTLIKLLKASGIQVKGKNLRGINLDDV